VGSEEQRFFAVLLAFDHYPAFALPLGASAKKLFQGPAADALMHVGQIDMLRQVRRFRAKIISAPISLPAASESNRHRPS